MKMLEQSSLNHGKIPDSLTAILQEKLALQVDVLTEALHKSRLPIWLSCFPSDIWLGAGALPLEQNLEGINLLFNPPASVWLRQGTSIACRIIDNLCKTKASERPTRAIVVLPEIEKDGKSPTLSEYARSKKFLEILRFPRGTFRFEEHAGFSQDTPRLMRPFDGEVSVFQLSL